MIRDAGTRRRAATRQNGRSMPDDDLAPEFDDDPEGGDCGDGAFPNDEASARAAWKDLAESSPIDYAIMVAYHVRMKMQELAAIMHLSNLYDVPRDALRALHDDFGAATLEPVFSVEGPKGELLRELCIGAGAVWVKRKFLRFARDKVRADQLAGKLPPDYRLSPDVPYQFASEFMDVYERVVRAVDEFSAVTGVSVADIDRLMDGLVDSPGGG